MIIFAEAIPGAVEEARRAVQEADAALTAMSNSVDSVGASGPVVWTPQLVQTLTFAVLIFGVVVLVLMTVLLYRNKESATQILRCFGLVLIVCLSAILLVVGYSNEQLTPIVGLFGAIAGYLLGRDARGESQEPRIKVEGQRGESSSG